MFYPYSSSPYIQSAMVQAMQAVMTGAPLPPNCYVMSFPIEQAHRVFPQLMMGTTPGGTGPMAYSPFPSYYDRFQPLAIAPYIGHSQNNALMPYLNHHSHPYIQNYNYPMLDYGKSTATGRYDKKTLSEPHSNVYNSSSFDSRMENLSWSRLFGHSRRAYSSTRQQPALRYEQKSISSKKQTAQSLSRSSSTTTSDETIRRVNLVNKQTPNSSSPKGQIKGSLPFKYSSDFVPEPDTNSSKKFTQKEANLRSDDEFVIQRTLPKANR